MRLFKLLLAFFCVWTSHGQVTVTTSNLKVNGVSITNNTINFNSAATVSVTLDVDLKTFNGTTSNTFGNLFLYYKASATENEVPIGFAPVTFIVTNPPFVTQTTYTSNLPNFVANLDKSAFFATGGIIYARYVNNNYSAYTSSNILIAGGSKTTQTNPPPFTGINTVCCSQTIRKGDKPALITGSPITVQAGQYIGWSKNGNASYGVNNYSTGNQLTTFQSDYLFDSCVYRRLVREGSGFAFSNDVNITVVQNPISSNNISTNAILMANGNYEIAELSTFNLTATGAQVNLAVLSNPNHIPTRRDKYAPSNEISYQWQFRNSFGDWKDIPNGTTGNIYGFVPQFYTTDYNFRRIAKYQNISLVSNIITVVFRRSSASNTICCNQLLTSTSAGISLPATIIGSAPVFSFNDGGNSSPVSSTASFVYQWQEQSRSLPWTNITGATNKNFLPPPITTPGVTINYRRIVRFTYSSTLGNLHSYETYSNTVAVGSPRVRQARISAPVEKFSSFDVVIYPNPVSSTLNVSASNNLDKANFKIYNTLGQEIKINFVNLDDDTNSIDVSSLQKGIYYLSIGDNSNTIKKFIKE